MVFYVIFVQHLLKQYDRLAILSKMIIVWNLKMKNFKSPNLKTHKKKSITQSLWTIAESEATICLLNSEVYSQDMTDFIESKFKNIMVKNNEFIAFLSMLFENILDTFLLQKKLKFFLVLHRMPGKLLKYRLLGNDTCSRQILSIQYKIETA